MLFLSCLERSCGSHGVLADTWDADWKLISTQANLSVHQSPFCCFTDVASAIQTTAKEAVQIQSRVILLRSDDGDGLLW